MIDHVKQSTRSIDLYGSLSCVINSFGRFNFYHICTQLSEHVTCHRPGQKPGKIDDLDVLKQILYFLIKSGHKWPFLPVKLIILTGSRRYNHMNSHWPIQSSRREFLTNISLLSAGTMIGAKPHFPTVSNNPAISPTTQPSPSSANFSSFGNPVCSSQPLKR